MNHAVAAGGQGRCLRLPSPSVEWALAQTDEFAPALTLGIEPLGALIRRRVQVGGREHGHDLVALS